MIYINKYMYVVIMETRKIILLGSSTFVVSLPKRWVESNKLKRGDALFLDAQRGSSLIIHPSAPKRELRETTINVDEDEKEETLTRKIISYYLNGYFSIRLISKKIFTFKQRKAIRDIAGKLYLRVMTASPREFLLQSLLDTSKIPASMGIRRMHVIALSMCRDTVKAFEQQDVNLASAVISVDDDVDQFSYMLLRLLRNAVLDPILADQMGLDVMDCFDCQTVVQRIEHVADNAVNLSRILVSLDRSGDSLPSFLLEPILEAGKKACRMYEEGLKAYFIKDAVSANKVIDSQVEIEKLNRGIIEKTTEEKRATIVCATCSIRDSIRRIADYATDIAEVTINQVFGRE